jgi:hypothetical protein
MIDDAQVAAELNELQGKLRFRMKGDDKKTLPAAGNWQRLFKDITPLQLYRRVKKAAGSSAVKIDVALARLGNPKDKTSSIFIIHNDEFDNLDEFGHPKSHLSFGLDGSTQVKLERLQLPREYQGKSITKRYLREMFAAFKELGKESVLTNAGEIGVYAWIKYGFIPTNENEGNTQTAIAQRLSEDGKHLQVKLGFHDTPPHKETVAYPITPEEYKIITDVLSTGKNKDLVQLAELKRVIGKIGGHDLTVGKALLINLSAAWQGVLNLKDGDPGYEKFKAYTKERSREI